MLVGAEYCFGLGGALAPQISEDIARQYLYEIGAIAIIVHPARVEACSRPFPSQTRDKRYRRNDRSTIRRRSWKGERAYADITLDGKNLVKARRNVSGMAVKAGEHAR